MDGEAPQLALGCKEDDVARGLVLCMILVLCCRWHHDLAKIAKVQFFIFFDVLCGVVFVVFHFLCSILSRDDDIFLALSLLALVFSSAKLFPPRSGCDENNI